MLFLDRLAYFLITRAKAVVKYLEKFTQPRYIIAFVIMYPHIYRQIVSVIYAAQQLMIDIAEQYYSWIEATFWGVYGFIKDKLRGIWFGDQIAFILAGITMALPYLTYIILRYAFVPIALTLLTVSLNLLGVVFYVFCRVVIPALKTAFGAYLFAKFMPASYKYVAKALDRFAQGKFGGFVGALFGTLAPFSMFFVGPLIISAVADRPCTYATVSPIIAPPYEIPYSPIIPYEITLSPAMSWIATSAYGQYLQQPPAVISFISAYASWDIQRQITFSYITPLLIHEIYRIPTYISPTLALSYIVPHIAYVIYGIGVYWPYYPGAYLGMYWPYYPGAYPSPAPALSTIYPYFSYLVAPGYISEYLPYTLSVIHASLSSLLTAGTAYMFTHIEDLSYIASAFPMPEYISVFIEGLSYIMQGYPTPEYIHTHIEDLGYIVYATPTPVYVYTRIEDFGFLISPVEIRAGITDYSYIVYPW
jgi:hypothetical protein